MRTTMSHAGRPAFYTVRKAALILGLAPSTLHRAIRLGTIRAERQKGRLVIPTAELKRLLGSPIDADQQAGGHQ
ncbi:helix-turn-helix domain-containing protein [Saccharopolyspora sp. CA-218241]|uniref:helix-turn-helix domain-containing protein n=1 Tax=Saccharopolyspora sp. CA-218241 TaxID=3240027 RepID=UPI003D999297